MQKGLLCSEHTWKIIPASNGGLGGIHFHLSETILRLCCLGTQPFVFCALHRSKNETEANEVLASIQSYFKSQPFDFRGAQIISGQEEGVYGWITANYLMGNFLEVCGNKCMVFISPCLSCLPGGDRLSKGTCQQGHLFCVIPILQCIRETPMRWYLREDT